MTASPTGTDTGPYSIAAECDLFDDYVFTDNVIVDTTATNQVAAFAAPDGSGLACLAIVGDDTRGLVYVRATAGVSCGWTVSPIAGTSGVTQVVAVAVGGRIVAVFQDGANSYGAILDPGVADDWTVTPAMDPFVNDLQISVSVDGSSAYIYASVNGSNSTLPIRALSWNATSGAFDQLDMSEANCTIWGLRDAAELAYMLVQTSESRYDALLVSNGRSAENDGFIGLNYAGCTLGDGAVQPNPPSVPSGASDDIAILHLTVPAERSAQVLYRQNDDQQVYVLDNLYYSDLDDSTTTGFAYQQATVRGGDTATIYGVAADGTLTSLHQSGVDDNGMPTWAEPISIAPGLASVAAPATNTDGDLSLMAVDVDGVLTACLLDDVGGWTIRQVEIAPSATPAPLDIATYQVEIQVRDQFGNPAAGVELVLSAAAALGVNHRDTAYVVGPDNDQQPALPTDSTGRLTISSYAFSITAQPLTVTAPDGTALTVAPDQPIADFFTGASPRNGVTFSSDSLMAATVPGTTTPLAPTLQGNPGLADAAAGGLGVIMALHGAPADATSVTDPTTQKPVYGYTLDVSDPTTPQFTLQTTPDEAATARAVRSDRALLGGLFHDLDKFAHDVWHGIKSGVATVEQWAVDIEKRTVSIFATIADDVSGWVDLAIDGAEAIGSIAHSIFHAIGAAVKDVIAWVKALFEWDDIIDTKKALEFYLTGVFPAIVDTIDTIQQKLASWSFGDQEQAITDRLSSWSKQLQGSTLTDLAQTGQNSDQAKPASTPPTSLGVSSLGSSSAPTADTFTKGPKNTWFLNKVVVAAGSHDPVQNFTTAMGDDLTLLLHTFTTTWSDLETQVESFGSSILQLAKADPRHVLEQGVADFLALIAELVGDLLAVADAIVTALLGLIGAVLGVADQVWTQQLDSLPLIGPLLDGIADVTGLDFGKLDLAGIVSLVLAIPVTIAYKLTNDGKAPFPNPPSTSGTPPSVATTAPLVTGAGDTSDAASDDSGRGNDSGGGDDSGSGDDSGDTIDPQALAFANTGAMALGTLIGIGSDLIPSGTEVPKLVRFLFLAPGVLGKGLTWPGWNFTPIELESAEDWAKAATWGYGLIGLIKGVAEASVDEALLEPFEDPVLLGFDTAIGIGALLVGLISLDFVDEPSAPTVALKIIDPLPEIVTFVKSKAFTSEVVGLNLAVKVAVDVIAGFASVALTGLEAVEEG